MRRAALALALAACSRSEPTKLDAPRPWLGVDVGATTLPDARAILERRGLTCEDASVMAMMRAAHAQHGVAAGPDGGVPAGAPPAGHQQYLDDPALQQGRVSCVGLALGATDLGHDVPAHVPARVLLVSARADGPVTLLAIQRTYPRADPDGAADDARAMFAALADRYGEAAERHGDVPAAGTPLPAMTPIRRRWALAGATVEASATDLGGSGISVSEELRAP